MLQDPYLWQLVNTYNLDMQRLYGEYIEHSRYLTLMHCAKEIYENDVEGSVAEVGVFMGLFAQYINKFFPDRKLHLYDTFTGFPEEDLEYDVNRRMLNGKHDYTMFSRDTSVELVMSKMLYPDKCKLHIGKVPDTFEYNDEKFCFVSIDPDLYLPTYVSLEYFYPKVSRGGYIFIHDYNHGAGDFNGIKSAVDDYKKNYHVDLKYVPISDFSGTIVIVK
jgi:O-methyltransferase